MINSKNKSSQGPNAIARTFIPDRLKIPYFYKMTNTSLKIEINSLPKELRDEVARFVASLKEKSLSQSNLKAREFGFAKGKIELASDFDAPLDEMKDYS